MIRRLVPFAFLLLVGMAIGYGVATFNSPAPQEKGVSAAAGSERKILYWRGPMDPNYRSDKPGKSPMGMDLIPVYEGEEPGADASSVQIDPSVVNNIGVRTAPVEYGSLRRPIHTVGRIVLDEEKVANVNLRTSGWIQRLAVRATGEAVKKGALLFNVYSPDLVNAQAEFIQSLRGGNAAHINAGKDRLRALFISEDQISELEQTRTIKQYVRFYAPIDGVVTALNVADGQFFKPDTEIMALADLSTVWLMSDVFESDADQLRIGAVVTAQSKFESGVNLSGSVDYIYPDLNPVTRTIPVRTVFDNAEGKLKPGMYMTVDIEGLGRPVAAIIPRPALIRTGRQERVILALGGGRFQPAAVTSGVEVDGKVEILAGLSAKDVVVISGQFLIDSESSLAGAALRMQPVANATNASATVEGVGVFNGVSKDRKSVNISYEAIAAIGWSAMTMDIPLAPDVVVANFAIGSKVRFQLGKMNQGDYAVTQIAPDHAGHESTPATPPAAPTTNDRSDGDSKTGHAEHASIEPRETETLIRASGILKSVDAAEQTMTVEHDPIPEIGWPATTMEFSVAHGVDLSGFPAGERISFALSLIKDRGYIVQSVEGPR